jgi:F420-dependent oxidoreductase-like protein
MDFAFRVRLHHTSWQDLRDVWRVADDLGVFESGWVSDHFYPTRGDVSGPCLESWTTLAALGEATQNVRLGVMVSCNAYRHPAVLAKMAATVDNIAGGRLELGLGIGGNQDECDAYGIALPPLTERFDALDEACEVLSRLLSQPVTSFSGNHYQLVEAYCEPKPPQRPHPPICIGGAGERRTLRSVARYAQHWNFRRGRLEELDHKREVLARHCADVGRDPHEIEVSMHLPYTSGSTGALEEHVQRFVRAGIDRAIVLLPEPLHVDEVYRVAEVLRPFVESQSTLSD